MKKENKIFSLIILLLLILIFFMTTKVFAKNQENKFSTVEYTEEFKKWLELSEEEKKNVLMPRMFEIPYTKSVSTNPLNLLKNTRASIDSKYSLKDIIPDNVQIRNQETTNLCWGFARLSSLETNLALSNYKKGINLSKIYDFSERHMEYATSRWFENEEENQNGYSRNVGDGGTYLIADSYLSSGMGAILEEEMPFENNENIISIEEIKNKNTVTQLYDTINFPDYNDEKTNEEKKDIMNQIKQHIQNYGSIYAGIHGASADVDGTACYNNDTGAKFCDNLYAHKIDHAVSIIGWDDNYSINNFNEASRPKSNGAWIVRNSWGEKVEVGNLIEVKEQLFEINEEECIQKGWDSADKIPNEYIIEKGFIIEEDKVYLKVGDNGLMYISYEDVNVSSQLSGIVKATDTVNYDNIYQYDILAPNLAIGYGGNSVMLCNIFDKKTTGSEYLTQVSLYAPQTYTCKVYVNPNGTSKAKKDLQLVQLKAGESETFGVGYHTIEFARPIEIKGDSYAIVIEIKSKENQTVISMEGKEIIQIGSLYKTVKTETNKCFMATGNDLDNCEWDDLSKMSEVKPTLPNGDSTIKAYTTLELIDESLKNIEIVTPPTKTSYFEGDNFDATGMVVKANYNSKNNPSVILDNSSYSITNGRNLKAGQTSVTITFEDKSVNQPITVEKNTITELKIKNPPIKTEYKEGEHFNKEGMIVEATYKDGTTKIIENYEIKGGYNVKANQTTVTISYEDKEITQAITVIPNPLIEINVTKEPSKTKYVEGQNFDKTGMVVTGTFEDKSTNEIIEYTIENGTNLTKEQNSVTINYEGKTTTQAITVEEKSIVEIVVEKKPSKLKYIQNKEELDLSGGILKVVYNDDSTENIPLNSKEIEVAGFDNTKTGKQKLIIKYQSKTTELEIEIVEEEKAENSNFDNAKVNVNKVKAYYYTDESKKDYILIDIEINQIVKNLKNDKCEYYYYLSSNEDEKSINKWTKITEEQKNNEKLQFTIDSRKVSNYNEIADENVLYLYIKEVAIKGEYQSIAITDSMKIETNDKIEVYLDNVKVDNINSGNVENPEDSSNNTIASGKLPNAGEKSILILIGILVIAGLGFYARYRNLNKYVK